MAWNLIPEGLLAESSDEFGNFKSFEESPGSSRGFPVESTAGIGEGWGRSLASSVIWGATWPRPGEPGGEEPGEVPRGDPREVPGLPC